ncbi:tonsoku-like protein [Motacilla alba alba]|uniref:tonsoku-like protein n=1 Tax=Motacilla alba alba TaxID=1094192 RepID=UPI0018D5010B|nr:tonsoku-like protein [Motacilla alba alba]
MADELSAEAAREIRQLQKSKEKSRRVGNAAEEAAACNRLGEILAAHGRFREALEQHREELRLLEGAGDALGCAVAHRKVGERLAELQSFPQALQHQLQHLFLARQLGDPAEQQRAWATIGRTFLFMAEGPEPPDVPELPEFPEFPQIPEGSLEAEDAAENSGSEGNSGILGAPAALRRALQAFHNSLSVLDTQLEGVLPCRELARVLPCRELSRMRSRLLLNLALVQESLGNHGRCSRLLRRSALLAEECHSLEDQFRAHFNLGLLQQRGAQLPDALRSLGRARDCARGLGEPRLHGEAEAALAQVLLALGDLRGAGRALRRALALGNPGTADGNRGPGSRRHARRVCRCLALLSRADPAVPSLSLSLCERLGDSLARLGHFQRAADFYQRQLSLAESLGLPARELAVIHVSLGTTFRDLGLHRRALRHFQSELELRKGEPLEECRTWLNVALALEDSGSAPSQLLPALHSALSCARSAGDARLQVSALKGQEVRVSALKGQEVRVRCRR